MLRIRDFVHFRWFAFAVFLGSATLLRLTPTAQAQSDYGAVAGFVRDPSGGVIPNARVIVKNEATGAENAATTNESGYFVVSNVPSGYYTVTAEVAGFKRFES